MLVKDRMTRHPIIISPSTKATEAQKIMAENHVRHLPVASDGKILEGLVTRTRLSFKPDMLGSLDMWEITRQLGDLTVKDVMVKKENVLTIGSNRTIERAAKIMADEKVGCLPVIDNDGAIEGIITDVDLLRSYHEMLGLPAEGLRVTVRMPNKKGEFTKLMKVLGDNGWGVMVLKIPRVTAEQVNDAFSNIEDQEVVDIRDAV